MSDDLEELFQEIEDDIGFDQATPRWIFMSRLRDPDWPRCEARTKKGEPCKNPALSSTTLCSFHNKREEHLPVYTCWELRPPYVCSGKTAKGYRCLQIVKDPGGRCHWHK